MSMQNQQALNHFKATIGNLLVSSKHTLETSINLVANSNNSDTALRLAYYVEQQLLRSLSEVMAACQNFATLELQNRLSPPKPGTGPVNPHYAVPMTGPANPHYTAPMTHFQQPQMYTQMAAPMRGQYQPREPEVVYINNPWDLTIVSDVYEFRIKDTDGKNVQIIGGTKITPSDTSVSLEVNGRTFCFAYANFKGYNFNKTSQYFIKVTNLERIHGSSFIWMLNILLNQFGYKHQRSYDLESVVPSFFWVTNGEHLDEAEIETQVGPWSIVFSSSIGRSDITTTLSSSEGATHLVNDLDFSQNPRILTVQDAITGKKKHLPFENMCSNRFILEDKELPFDYTTRTLPVSITLILGANLSSSIVRLLPKVFVDGKDCVLIQSNADMKLYPLYDPEPAN